MSFARIALLLPFFGILNPSVYAESSSIKKVRIFSLSDTYEIKPVDKGTLGGMARIATFIRRAKAENPNTLFVDSGDFIGSSVSSKVFEGQQMIAVKNRTGLNAATYGNHEFDFGARILKTRIAEANFPFLSANVFDRETGELFAGALPYLVQELDGIRIGFFGVTLVETEHNSAPGPNVEFRDPVLAATKAVAELKSLGVDVIVALTHLRLETDVELIKAVAGIDAVIGGHEHEIIQKSFPGPAKTVPLIKAGTNGRHLGVVEISVDTASRKVDASTSTVEMNDSIPPDPEVVALVDLYEAQLKEKLDVQIAEAANAFDMRRSEVFVRPSPLAIFFSNIFRERLKTDISILNGGGLRNESVLGPGPVSLRDIQSFFPYPDPVMKIEISGENLLEILEHSLVEAGPGNPRFLHYSGMEMEYDLENPPGERVLSVSLNGIPLERSRKYSLAVDSFLYRGGDSFDFSKTRLLVPMEEALSKVPAIYDVIRGKILKLNTITGCVEALNP